MNKAKLAKHTYSEENIQETTFSRVRISHIYYTFCLRPLFLIAFTFLSSLLLLAAS